MTILIGDRRSQSDLEADCGRVTPLPELDSESLRQWLKPILVTIPHSKIWSKSISNANGGELEAQVITELYFAHEVDTE